MPFPNSNSSSNPHTVPQPAVRPIAHPRQRSNSTPTTPTIPHALRAPVKGREFERDARHRNTYTPDEILFYDKDQPYYSFTNFSPDPVEYKGREYPTSEHLFQAMKFIEHRPNLAEHIRTHSKYPRDAFTEAQRLKLEIRSDWPEVKIQVMRNVLRLKFKQHPKLRKQLIGTGDAYLIEDSPVDSYWGIGADKRGQNQLGKALMVIRKELQQIR